MIAGQESIFDVLNSQKMVLEAEIRQLKLQVEGNADASRRLFLALADRERRIAELEHALKTAAEKTLKKIEAIRKIRLVCEEETGRLVQIKALEKCATDVSETRIRELMEFMDGIETGIGKIYASRRWRFANFWRLLGRLISRKKSRPLSGYQPIDKYLERYRAWRDMYLNDSGD